MIGVSDLASHVNRAEELQAFQSMFSDSSLCNVMVVDGDRSMGKTSFLQKCGTVMPEGARVCWVDFKQQGVGSSAPEVVSFCIQRLDINDRFPETLKLLRQDPTSVGGSHTVYEDILTKQFVSEVKHTRDKERPDVVVLDSLEHADESVRTWISRALIGNIVSDPLRILKLLIAGQGVRDLEHAHPTGIIYRELRPLRLEDAVEMAQMIGLDCPEEEIRKYHLFAAGNPLLLATGFDRLKRRDQTRLDPDGSGP